MQKRYDESDLGTSKHGELQGLWLRVAKPCCDKYSTSDFVTSRLCGLTHNCRHHIREGFLLQLCLWHKASTSHDALDFFSYSRSWDYIIKVSKPFLNSIRSSEFSLQCWFWNRKQDQNQIARLEAAISSWIAQLPDEILLHHKPYGDVHGKHIQSQRHY